MTLLLYEREKNVGCMMSLDQSHEDIQKPNETTSDAKRPN